VEEPSAAELEDSFLKYAGPVKAKRKQSDSWQLRGTPEHDGFVNLTCFRMSAQEVSRMAHQYGVSVTSFLCAVLMQALQQLQKEHVPNIRRRKPIKVYIPINLRNMFDSQTLRNFILFTIPQLDTRLGEYTFPEICQLVHHWMGLDATPRKMAMMIASNVSSEQSVFVKVIPLFLKNIIMKIAFFANGERKSCLSLSNLGRVTMPEEMKEYIEYMDFIMGVKATSPYNCGVISCGDQLRVNFVRKTQEPELEVMFFKVLRELGISVEVSSNGF
jgi:hypothetical protein